MSGTVYRISVNGGSRWEHIQPRGWISEFYIYKGYIYGIGRDKAVYKTSANGGEGWQRIKPGSITKIFIYNDVIYGIASG